MKVVLFGASGMVGQGALRESLLDGGVDRVLSVVRRPTGRVDPKLRELVAPDFHDFSALASDLTGYDACFFCLGVSSNGLSEAEYSRVTCDIAVAAGSVLSTQNPGMTFIFVSGAGTDETGVSRMMWARVKGRAENAIRAMPFRRSYMFRPGFIQPLHGITSRTALYRNVLAIMKPVLPLLRGLSGAIVSTEDLGRAMLNVARNGSDKPILEARDIRAASRI